MSTTEFRNDSKAIRIINILYAEGVSPENITRLLNYHFDETYSCQTDARNLAVIRRIANSDNYAPPITVWSQTK